MLTRLGSWLALALLVAPLAGCPGARPHSGEDAGEPTTDGAIVATDDAAPDTGPTCACGAGQICSATGCVDLPSGCPCPVGSYCDLANDRCVAGCSSNAECDAAHVCDVARRTCVPGCRTNADCALGTLCDAMQCAPGCSNDAGCPASAYCRPSESEGGPRGTCASRCTGPTDTTCATQEYCSGDRCVSCGTDESTTTLDPQPADLSSFTATQICPTGDVDYMGAVRTCSGTCSDSTAVRWIIEAAPGLVPVCQYYVLDGDTYELRASTLTGPTPGTRGDQWVCTPVATVLFESVSSQMFFDLGISFVSGTGEVYVEPERLR